jgi:hypothetical protein
MAGQAESGAWDKGFFRAIAVSLKDIRLGLIVIPSLILAGLALVLLKPTWLAGAVSFGLALVARHLISKIEELPRPNEKELTDSLYHKVLLPAATGILMIPSVDLFGQLWAVQWHWFHTKGSIPPCSFIWTVGILVLLGNLVVPAVTALLTRERAVFATIVGLMVYIPMSLTMGLSGDNVQQMTSLLAKSCQMDTDGFATDGFGVGMVTAVLSKALVAIFVAKVVSTWLSGKNAPAP